MQDPAEKTPLQADAERQVLAFDSNDAAQQRAIEQAAKDSELLEALRARAKERAENPEETEVLDGIELASPEEALRPLNRAERRQMVHAFKANLKNLPRAVPVRNPTIVPKSKRRRRRK